MMTEFLIPDRPPYGQPRVSPGLAVRAAARSARAIRHTVIALAGCAVAVGAAACSTSSSPATGSGKGAPVLAAKQAPATWHRATLPGGGAVLAFPPSMHLVTGDAGTVSAARLSVSGKYLLYLNVTPRQGNETLRDWAGFRIDHQRDENTPAVRKLSEQSGVRFLGGTGTCVTDAYVTKVDSNHYTEIACFVRGQTSATVIVAAAPTADWASAAGVLRRAIAGYLVR
jgi:hypothetical protein